MTTDFKIPRSALSGDAGTIVPAGVTGDDIIYQEFGEGARIVFQTKGDGVVSIERSGGYCSMTRWRPEAGVSGSVLVTDDQPVKETLFESAQIACQNYIRSHS